MPLRGKQKASFESLIGMVRLKFVLVVNADDKTFTVNITKKEALRLAKEAPVISYCGYKDRVILLEAAKIPTHFYEAVADMEARSERVA